METVRSPLHRKGLGDTVTGAVTKLLRAWCDGHDDALEQLTPLVEAELRRLARGYMRRELRVDTLQTTASVNEAFLWPGAGREQRNPIRPRLTSTVGPPPRCLQSRAFCGR